MRKLVLILASSLLFASFANIGLLAQSGVILKGYDNKGNEFNQFEKAAISAVGMPNCKMPTKELVIQRRAVTWDGKYDAQGKEIVKDTSWQEIQTWQYFGQSLIANGLYNIEAYRSYIEEGRIFVGACVGYVLRFANMNEGFSNAFSFEKQDNATKKSIKSILRDKSYHEGIYQWLKPALVLAWRTLGSDVKEFYVGLVAYVETFDYSVEKKYYESLTESEKWRFCAYEPDGRPDDRRKAKAWIFRRIYFDGWDLAYTHEWINRFTKEVMSKD